jgi:hypothetical protein
VHVNDSNHMKCGMVMIHVEVSSMNAE